MGVAGGGVVGVFCLEGVRGWGSRVGEGEPTLVYSRELMRGVRAWVMEGVELGLMIRMRMGGMVGDARGCGLGGLGWGGIWYRFCVMGIIGYGYLWGSWQSFLRKTCEIYVSMMGTNYP